jgi:hypothetical protein
MERDERSDGTMSTAADGGPGKEERVMKKYILWVQDNNDPRPTLVLAGWKVLDLYDDPGAALKAKRSLEAKGRWSALVTSVDVVQE